MTLTKNEKIGVALSVCAVVGGLVVYLFRKRKAKKTTTEPANKEAAATLVDVSNQ